MVLAWCPSRRPESEPVRVNATEQCELLATAHKEAEAFKDLAQRKCEELDAEVAALQTDLREREAYMATQQAALSAMEEEAHAQAAADAQDEARFRGDLQALLDAHLWCHAGIKPPSWLIWGAEGGQHAPPWAPRRCQTPRARCRR